MMLLRAVAILAVAAGGVGFAEESFPADEIHWTITGQTSVTIDWRGSEATVSYGPTKKLGQTVEAVAPVPLPFSSRGPFREAKITGLAENTLYYYAIGKGATRSGRRLRAVVPGSRSTCRATSGTPATGTTWGPCRR